MANGKEKLAKNWKRLALTIFIEHPDWNAGQIHRQLVVVLGEGRAPASVSSVQKVLPEWKKNHSPDRPWSMGAFIPQGDIEPVFSLQRQLLKHGRYLTTRRARWYSILYPILAPLMEQAYPNDTTQNELRTMQIASFYCRKEQMAEVNGELLDTFELDGIFLIGQNVGFEAVLREWVNLFLSGIEQLDDSVPVLDIGENTESLSQFINLLMQSGVEQAIAFVRQHLETKPLAEEWLILSTRQDIMNLRKNNKEGEK